MMNEVFPQGYAWLDGNFVELSKAKIPILDWGFLRSDATYDVCLLYTSDAADE